MNEKLKLPSCNCPKCDALPRDQEVRDYDMMWGDGKVFCKKCGAFVRNIGIEIDKRSVMMCGCQTKGWNPFWG